MSQLWQDAGTGTLGFPKAMKTGLYLEVVYLAITWTDFFFLILQIHL